MASPPDDYDGPWKEALEAFFRHFTGFFLPDVHADVDWSEGVAFLDTELRRLAPRGFGPGAGRGVVDKLARVQLKTGEEVRLLVHVEVQQSPQWEFAERMHRYHSRLADTYGPQVVSCAILADRDPSWRPDTYEFACYGTEERFRFRTDKLLDHAEEDLVRSDNPFAFVVLAHLKTQASRGEPRRRLQWKRELTDLLIRHQWSDEPRARLFRLLDWLMRLPAEQQAKFERHVEHRRKETEVTFLTKWEREAQAKGQAEGQAEARREDLVTILEARFPAVPDELVARLRALGPDADFDALIRSAAVTPSLEAFRSGLPETDA